MRFMYPGYSVRSSHRNLRVVTLLGALTSFTRSEAACRLGISEKSSQLNRIIASFHHYGFCHKKWGSQGQCTVTPYGERMLRYKDMSSANVVELEEALLHCFKTTRVHYVLRDPTISKSEFKGHLMEITGMGDRSAEEATEAYFENCRAFARLMDEDDGGEDELRALLG